MVTISVCMIVKNEEKVLAGCLDSLEGLWEELIIVDTGSTDATKEIARKYTDKVYDFAWTGNFSDARNYSFSKAGCDYIYSADADEVLDEENRNKFHILKNALTADSEIEIVQMYYGNQLSQNSIYNFDKEYRPKLYKRIREFRFMDPIHEVVQLEPVVFDSDVEIMHLPTSPHGARDIKNFEKMIREGKPVSKRLHSMYAKELFIAGTKEDFINAREFFLESAEDMGRSEDEVNEAFCVVTRCARISGDTETFFKYALKGIAGDGSAELCCELGDYYLEKKDYNEAALWYSNAAFETECILNIKYKEEYPLKKLIVCYEEAGNDAMADEIRKMMEGDFHENC